MELFLESNISGTDLFDAMLECSENINRVISSLYITDVILESSALTEAETESQEQVAIKKSKTSIIETFKNLLEKIKQWFRDVFVKLKLHFSQAEAFYKKNKDKIDKLAGETGTNYKLPQGMKWYNFEADPMSKVFEDVVDTVKEVMNSTYESIDDDDEKYNSESFNNDIIKALRSVVSVNSPINNMADFKRVVNADILYRPAGRMEMFSFKLFTVNPAKVIMDFNKDLNDIQKLFNDTNKIIHDATDRIQRSREADKVTELSKVSNAGIAIINQLSPWAVNFYLDRVNWCVKILKFTMNYDKRTKTEED